jgi:hypothetical protein
MANRQTRYLSSSSSDDTPMSASQLELRRPTFEPSQAVTDETLAMMNLGVRLEYMLPARGSERLPDSQPPVQTTRQFLSEDSDEAYSPVPSAQTRLSPSALNSPQTSVPHSTVRSSPRSSQHAQTFSQVEADYYSDSPSPVPSTQRPRKDAVRVMPSRLVPPLFSCCRIARMKTVLYYLLLYKLFLNSSNINCSEISK